MSIENFIESMVSSKAQMKDIVKIAEWMAIREALRKYKGNQTESAIQLKMNRGSFRKKMNEYGINPGDYMQDEWMVSREMNNGIS